VAVDVPDDVLTQVLGNLEDELVAVDLGGHGIENGGELLSVELDIDDGTYLLLVLVHSGVVVAGFWGGILRI
jgi:hypothetical protein